MTKLSGEIGKNTEEEVLQSDSQSNDMESEPGRMEMTEDNASKRENCKHDEFKKDRQETSGSTSHSDKNIDQDGASMERTGYVSVQGKGRNVICSSCNND